MSNGGGVGGTSTVIALSIKSRGTHFIAGSGNNEQSVSRNNEVLRRGCFSREKPPFSRWAPQSSEGVGGNESWHPSQKKPGEGSPGPMHVPPHHAVEGRGTGQGAEGSPKCSSWLWVGCPPFTLDPAHFLRGICDFWCTHIALDRQGRSTAVTMTTKKKKKEG